MVEMVGFNFPSEIYQNIFENLDTKSLSSSILVNRVWCLNSIKILWKDPFSVLHENPSSNFQLRTLSIIQTYIYCLSDEIKSQLILDKVPIDKLRPTFEYTSFLCVLHLPDLYNSIGSWLAQYHINIRRDGFQHKLLMKELCKLFLIQCKELKALDFSGVPNIRHLIHHKNNIRDYEIFFELPGVISYFKNLQYFRCKDDFPSRMLISLASLANNIFTLDITRKKDNEGLVELINTQENLRHFKFKTYKMNLLQVVRELQKKSSTLRKVKFNGGCSIPLDFLYQLTKLEKLSLHNSQMTVNGNVDLFKTIYLNNLIELKISLEDQFVQHYISLIQNTKGSLKVIKMIFKNPKDPKNLPLLFKTIMNCCPNLINIHIYIPNKIIFEILNFFRKCPLLEIVIFTGDNLDISNILLKIVPVLPYKMKTLNLGFPTWEASTKTIDEFRAKVSSTIDITIMQKF
ncbi:113_t:CDS:2 [Diversispora eburnea]|uniref:113_t:CDS:1 n=1 Tax=Diversispora eburnea TaxID=1213867 RepID=A0A9N8VR88_9GLOM|nr:113_t:CDS:2 [Diversispora eburnea]